MVNVVGVSILVIIATVLLYAIAKLFEHPPKPTVEKVTPYACGEDLPPISPTYHFVHAFLYAAIFVAVDIVAIVASLAYTLPSNMLIFPILFLIAFSISLLTVVAIYRMED